MEKDRRVFDIMGTDQYIAPESYCGYYSEASDVFAIGIILPFFFCDLV